MVLSRLCIKEQVTGWNKPTDSTNPQWLTFYKHIIIHIKYKWWLNAFLLLALYPMIISPKHTSELSESKMGWSWHKEKPFLHDTCCYIYTFSHFDLWDPVHYIHLHPRYLTHAGSVSPLVPCVTVLVFTSLRNITFAGSGTINQRISKGTSIMESHFKSFTAWHIIPWTSRHAWMFVSQVNVKMSHPLWYPFDVRFIEEQLRRPKGFKRWHNIKYDVIEIFE